MSHRPSISVLVLCHNAGPFITECLVSVHEQEHSSDLQLVIVDDGSSDDSVAMIEAYLQAHRDKYADVQFIQNEDTKGPTLALYDGLNACTGDYVAYLEGDDYWTDAQKLAKQVDLLNLDESLVGVGTGVQFVNAWGESIPNTHFNRQDTFRLSHRDTWYYPVFQSSSLLFRNVWSQYPEGFTRARCNDKLLLNFISLEGDILYDPKVTSAYRFHTENITSSMSKSAIFRHHLWVNRRLFYHHGMNSVMHYEVGNARMFVVWLADQFKRLFNK